METLRHAMVQMQLRARGISDPAVLRVMETIPRHEFIPPEEQRRAYDDCPLPIGWGQTISQPYIVAYMTELLELRSTHRVLEVGTGSGYQTAVLAALTAGVFTIDIHGALVQEAQRLLTTLGFTNIRFDVRNGYLGWPEFAPFDRIVVTAGASFIPQPLVDQLSEGGRMVIPVGETDSDQVLKLVLKHSDGRVDIQDKLPVRFVPLLKELEKG